MNRYKARENAFIACFELSFMPAELDAIIELSRESGEYEVDEFGEKLLKAYYNNSDDVDNRIKENLKGWQLERIPRVCAVIMRLAVAEMLYLEEATDSTIINNAVELCKKYAGDDDYQFVNGVLGTIQRSKAADNREEK